MNELKVREFLDDYKNELNYLVEQFNFNAQKPCNNMPWLIVDKYLNGNFQHDFNKSKISELLEKTKSFKIIISVLDSFVSDFGDLISAISLSSNDYKRNYESHIKSALEKEIENKLKGKDWTFDKSDLISNNEYINLYEICQLNLEIVSKIHVGYGFKCELSKETVKAIFNLMVASNQISGNLTDFMTIFSKESIPVENPVKWLILNNRGTNPDRGNQTALFVFLELILKKVSNQDLIKSKDLFIDEKGKFIKNKLLRPDKDKLKKYGFETQLKDILKKADQPKNQ